MSSAINDLITRAATRVMDMDEYDRKYADLEVELHEAITKLEATEAKINDRRERLTQVRAVLTYLETQPPLQYSDEAWIVLVDHATVGHDGTITVMFKDEASL